MNKRDASTLLYKGLLSYSEKPFGTSPSFIFVENVFNTSFAISNFLEIRSSPSNEINESLAQSKNHGYPAIIVCNLFESLKTIKLSLAIIYFLIINL